MDEKQTEEEKYIADKRKKREEENRLKNMKKIYIYRRKQKDG